MNREQIKKINDEILRLISRENKSDISDSQDYIDGRVDSLEWVKENI
jgi:hypothetical protein